VDEIRRGGTNREIFEADPTNYIKYTRGILASRILFQGSRDYKTEVFWCYGETGSGKSRWASEQYPTAYWKAPTSKWWCGYDQHDAVIIDDYRRDFSTFGDLLRLFDRYPLIVETKGGSVQFLAKTIVVTTPKNPRDTWDSRTEEDIQQLLRRITEIKHFAILQQFDLN
jgi:hypothetical protein